MTSSGRVWKFGDDVNTDLIIPGRYLSRYDEAHLTEHAMEGLSESFAKEVSPGDVIVAGGNFGCGSSREQAATVLKRSGVAAIVAKSYARIFYRNSINLGLHVFESDEAYDSFSDGDAVVLDSDGHVLSSSDGAKVARLKEIPHHARKILDSGGLVPHIKGRLGTKEE